MACAATGKECCQLDRPPPATNTTIPKNIAPSALLLCIAMLLLFGLRYQKARQVFCEAAYFFSVRVRLRLHNRLRTRRLIPVLANQANRSRVREAHPFFKNPAAKLLPEHHSQKTEQSHNGRRRAFYADYSIQNADKQAHRK